MVLLPGVALAASTAERRVTVPFVPLSTPVALLTREFPMASAMGRSAVLLTVKTAGASRSSNNSRAGLTRRRRGGTRLVRGREGRNRDSQLMMGLRTGDGGFRQQRGR